MSPDPSTSRDPVSIRRLPATLVNQIAAGEVIDRPASVVKELVENSLDAGATQIDVVVRDGGKSLISVRDNGIGMGATELTLAIERHATSKLPDEDLNDIKTLGFRGEALPSVGSIARLSITSRQRNGSDDHGWLINVEGGAADAPRPASAELGTLIEVKDLFYATPARLKFLKTDRAEVGAISDVMSRLALARPDVGFTLVSNSRSLLKAPTGHDQKHAEATRVGQVLGQEFLDNARAVSFERDGMHVRGWTSLPTHSRGTAVHQYLFVNDRPVKDKLLTGVIRAVYRELMPHGRHPMLSLWLDVLPGFVDVNVHPAKAEVRFRDPSSVRSVIINALRSALLSGGPQTTSGLTDDALAAFSQVQTSTNAIGFGNNAENASMPPPSTGLARPLSAGYRANRYIGEHQANAYQHSASAYQQQTKTLNDPLGQVQAFDTAPPSAATADPSQTAETEALDHHPLGAAVAQVHKNYIVSQTKTGMILVDQHAAHERLTLELLKAQAQQAGIARQALLIPEVVHLDAASVERLVDAADTIAESGLIIDAFGEGTIVVREVPSMLAEFDIAGLVRDIADELADKDSSETLSERLYMKMATAACHGSVRSGRKLNVDEMNALLRQMEAEPLSAQCNHGRPTFVTLSLDQIEKLFERK